MTQPDLNLALLQAARKLLLACFAMTLVLMAFDNFHLLERLCSQVAKWLHLLIGHNQIYASLQQSYRGFCRSVEHDSPQRFAQQPRAVVPSAC